VANCLTALFLLPRYNYLLISDANVGDNFQLSNKIEENFSLMGKIIGKIQEIALNQGITIGAIEKSIGASKGVLSRAINSGTDIQAKWVEAILENYPDVSAEWLLRDEGPMLKSELSSVVNHQSHVDGNTTVGGNSGMSEEFVAHLMEEKDKQINQLLQIISNK
jgi:hypothetical protein